MNYVAYIFIHTDKDIYDLDVKPNIVYISINDKWAKFKCPCGCSDEITLNLMEHARPCWRILGNTITPSVNKLYGCKSHFRIINGMTIFY